MSNEKSSNDCGIIYSVHLFVRMHSVPWQTIILIIYFGCLPFFRINRLGRALNNGKGFSKISKPTKRNGAYHL